MRDKVFAYLDSGDFRRAVRKVQRASMGSDRETAALMRQLSADRAQLLQIGDEFDDGQIKRDEYQRRSHRLRGRIDDSECAVRIDKSVPMLGIDVERVANSWDGMTIDERRTLVTALFTEITLQPAEAPANRFKPDRVDPVERFPPS